MNQRVLVAVASLTVRMHLIGLLREDGFQPLGAASKQDALALLESGDFAVGIFGADLGHDTETVLKEFKLRSPAAHTVLIGDDGADARTVDTAFSSEFEDPDILRDLRRATAATKGTVLVVDDSETYRQVLVDALRSSGFSVIDAPSGEDAIRLALDRLPSGLVVDNGLPGIDGTTVIRRLRQNPATRSIPALLLTASEDPMHELRALESGADTFVRKDQDLDVVVARVSAMLRSVTSLPGSEDSAHHARPRKVLIIGDDGISEDGLVSALAADGVDITVLAPDQRADTLEFADFDAAIFAVADEQEVDRFVRQLKSNPETRNVRAIRVGKGRDRDAVISALNTGVDDYVPTDAGLNILMARVRAQIRRKQLEDESREIKERLLRRQLEAEAQRAVAEARAARAEELSRAKTLAEEKAREAERVTAQLQSIFANLAEGILICDLEGKIVYVNDAALRFHNLASEQLAGQHVSYLAEVYEARHPSGQPMAAHDRPLSRALRGEHATGVEVLLVRRSDGRAWVGSFNITPVLKPDGQQILAAITIRDITGQKRAEEALRKSEKLAATGRLAAAIAHEINNPLEAVTNLLYLLEREKNAATALSYIHTAQRELDRVSEITKQTLAFHRDTTDAVEVDICALIKELLPIYRNYAGRDGTTLSLDLPCEAKMTGFPGELRQVFGNLISNAVDAVSGAHGKVKVRARALPVGNATGARAISIVVADNGSGMTPEVVDQIFQPFFTTKRSRGTGLGLWVVHSIIQKHGGQLSLRTATEGTRRGTTFRIVLPIESKTRRETNDDITELFRAIGRELLDNQT